MNWPSKRDREVEEINGFIESYKRLKHGRNLRVIEEREKPDRIVQDTETGEIFGIELTSEYIDNKSVPAKHKSNNYGYITDDQQKIDAYEKKILKRINEKVKKAREGYLLKCPLILSFYVNEYESIYMNEEYWRSFAKRNDNFFDSIDPFLEVVFWSLPNDLIVSVRKK